MTRTTIPTADQVPAASRPTLDRFHKMLGFTPNLQRMMALSPAALNGWAALQASLSTVLDVKTRDGIALAVSEVNGCEYCLAAHSWISAKLAKIPAEEIALNRQGRSADPKRAAAVEFARRLMQTGGKIDEADLTAVRSAGYSDAEIIEVIALVAQFMLTNFMNNAMDTDVDFPSIETIEAPVVA